MTLKLKMLTKMSLAALALMLTSLPSWAEQMVEEGGYQLHYMAMVTSDLSPEVAKAYGITRSHKEGVAILNLQKSSAPLISVPAQVKGRIRNLIGQERLDDLREVREQDAIYWLATFDFSHLETMRFDLEVTPNGEKRPLVVKFSQQFYTPGR